MNSRARFIETYGHNGRIGVLVELELDTTFTAQMSEFKELARAIAVQIAGTNPPSVEVLIKQPFVKRPEKLVGEVLNELSILLGEVISIVRFERWDIDAYPEPGPQPVPRLAAMGGTHAV